MRTGTRAGALWRLRAANVGETVETGNLDVFGSRLAVVLLVEGD